MQQQTGIDYAFVCSPADSAAKCKEFVIRTAQLHKYFLDTKDLRFMLSEKCKYSTQRI